MSVQGNRNPRTGEPKPPYRGDAPPVQGRRDPRTGEPVDAAGLLPMWRPERPRPSPCIRSSFCCLCSLPCSLFGLVKRGRIDQDSSLAVTHPSRLCPEKTQKRKVAGTEKRVRTPSAPASEGRLGKIFNFFRAVRFSPLKNPLSAVRTDEAAVHGNAGKVWHSFSRTVSAG